MKAIHKKDLTDQSKSRLQQEIEILQMIDHPNIIKLHETYDVSSDSMYHAYLVTELMTGGELFDRIVKKKYYDESEARDLCKILFSAVAYCHERNIAHRDLKPDNLLLKVGSFLNRVTYFSTHSTLFWLIHIYSSIFINNSQMKMILKLKLQTLALQR